MVANVGEIVTPTLAGIPMVMLALPDWVRSARDVATTVTVDGLGIVPGAVYKPSAVIIPQ